MIIRWRKKKAVQVEERENTPSASLFEIMRAVISVALTMGWMLSENSVQFIRFNSDEICDVIIIITEDHRR